MATQALRDPLLARSSDEEQGDIESLRHPRLPAAELQVLFDATQEAIAEAGIENHSQDPGMRHRHFTSGCKNVCACLVTAAVAAVFVAGVLGYLG